MTRRRSVRSGFEQRLLANLRACDLSGQRAVIGFSGGSDSLALAAAMSRLRPLLELDLLLVHIDHRLRTESHLDAEQCRKLALALDLPIRVIELPWGLADRSRGLGIEEQGRRERYLALASAASDWGTDVILTAHQANDQAETVLLHLFRGSGLPGLAGMRLAEE
ncbi:MAG: tRNA lysidine(34) synthetase TilS, partial [Thermomicrobiales bacterium]|nr:tRNA lysidine(34) synthetase TilS [Thermomicrobiales bacterium]